MTREAAGGVVVDRQGRVVIVHRPHRDDWSLPKGHLESGETAETAAVREVSEETGLRCVIDGPAGETAYCDHKGRDKRVRYFRMSVLGGTFTANDEVDEIRWVDADALDVLTYPADRAIAAAVLAGDRSAEQRTDQRFE